jgi:DNA-binding transcriptional ArsR family regulator
LRATQRVDTLTYVNETLRAESRTNAEDPDRQAAKTYNERRSAGRLGDATCLQVLDILREQGEAMSVTDVVARVGTLSQPTISYHLRGTGAAGLVTREGRRLGLPLAPTALREIASWPA